MQMFLDYSGYKCWKSESDSWGTTKHYQKRLDTLEEYSEYPLCYCNDTLLINITYSEYVVGDSKNCSYQLYLVHENQGGVWCDLKLYSLSEDQLINDLQLYEMKILEMWKLFF